MRIGNPKEEMVNGKIPIDIEANYVITINHGPFLAGYMCGKGYEDDERSLEEGIEYVMKSVKRVARDYIVKSEMDLSLPKETLELARKIYVESNMNNLFVLRYPKERKREIEWKAGRFGKLEAVLK